MPVGFNSPARNLFLLGSTGAQVVTNFFQRIDQSAGTDGVYLPDEIKYNVPDQKFLLAGSNQTSASKGKGWFEKRTAAGSRDWLVEVQSTQSNVNTTLRALEIDSLNNLIVCGKTGTVPWIAKYTNGGVISWQATSQTGDVEYTGIAIDPSNNLYACGSGNGDAFIEKLDGTGTYYWGKSSSTTTGNVTFVKCDANNRGEVVAVGKIEDTIKDKGYIAKVNTATGDLLWDRTIEDPRLATSSSYWQTECTDVYIDSKEQIYVVGTIRDTIGNLSKGFLIKYSPEGNIVWQKETKLDRNFEFYAVKSDGETQQTIVLGRFTHSNDDFLFLNKYSQDGTLLWTRTLYSSLDQTISNVSLDADTSFYYLLFTDETTNLVSGEPDTYTFGKVSTSGNGFGAFQYSSGGINYNYAILNITDNIGRLSDGSVRNDASDFITYPFEANKILFDDLATQVANKKVQIDEPNTFEYSGSPAIRVADFQELNLLGENVSGRTWTDTSGKSNNGIASLTEPFFGAGSVTFDGTGDHLRVATSALFNYGTNNFTIEFWWYPTSTDRQALFHGSWGQDWSIGIDFNGSANNQKLGMWASSSGTSWDMLIADAGGNGITTGTPTQNSWNHIAYVRNGTTFTLYLNGTNVGQVTGISAAINSKTTSREQAIGAWWNSEIAMSDVHGYLSNYRIVIGTAVYTSNFTPPSNSLTNIPGTVLLTCQGSSIVDTSSNNHSITVVGNSVSTNDGPVWNASGYWEFNGTNKKISVPYNNVWTLPNDFTLEAWIYRNSAFNANWWQDTIMGHDDGSGQNNKWIFSHNGTSLFFHTNTTAGSGQNIQAPTGWVPTNSVWYNVVVTRSGNTYTFYQNSTSLGTVTNSAAIPVAAAPLTIGNAEGSGLFNGRIGEVRVYPRALTAAQVFQNYNVTKSKYINEAPDTAPKIGSGIVSDNNLLLNYDFGNRATYDNVENRISSSENMLSPIWGTASVFTTVTPNSIKAPDGTYTADVVLETTNTSVHRFLTDPPNNDLNGYDVTCSVYVKRVGPNARHIYYMIQTGVDSYYAHFNLDTLTVNQQAKNGSGTILGAGIQDVGGGWYRIYISGRIPTVSQYNQIYFERTPRTGFDAEVYTGDGQSGFAIWGWQIERNPTPSRYIKTSGTAITAPTTVKNLSITSYTGTISGATFNSAGYFDFDGVNDDITVNSSGLTFTNQITLEVWCSADVSNTDYRVPIMRSSSSSWGDGYGMYHAAGEFYFYINVWNQAQRVKDTATTFGLTHWVGTYDGANLKLYRNGTLIQTGSSYTQNITTPTADLRIGKGGGNDYEWDGKIGEVRIYNRALSATEVSQNFNATRAKYGV